MYTPNGTAAEVLLVMSGMHMMCRSKDDDKTRIQLQKLITKYMGADPEPIPDFAPVSWPFCAWKILERIKEEGYETDKEIFRRIVDVIDPGFYAEPEEDENSHLY